MPRWSKRRPLGHAGASEFCAKKLVKNCGAISDLLVRTVLAAALPHGGEGRTGERRPGLSWWWQGGKDWMVSR